MSAQSGSINAKLRIFTCFQNSKYLSGKVDSYFQVYEEVLTKYVNQPVTFVEVGIAQGGSLFMWREFFGPQARIIGLDLNPQAKKWEKSGFEIFIGDQSDPLFWDKFYAEVGPVDIVLDDGGHTNKQQITTVDKAIENIKDGGTLIVEDVHTSYFKEFGNPSKYSFVNFTKRIADAINSRYPGINLPHRDYEKKVFSLSYYESMVVFHLDSRRCFQASPVSNNGIPDFAEDMRHQQSAVGSVMSASKGLSDALPWTKKLPVIKKTYLALLRFWTYLVSLTENRKLKGFFK